MKASYVYLFSGLLSAAMLVGCGGSSGGGGAAPADITAENADDLSVAATEATKAAIDAENNTGSPSSLPFKLSNSAPLQDKMESAIRSATDDYSSYICTSGGSASVDYNSDYTNGTFNFNNCDDGYATFSGTVSFSGDMTGSYSITYNNLVVTDNASGQSQTVSGTISCTSTGCNYDGLNIGGASLDNSDFSGDDGRNYSFEGDVTVTGDDTSGWNVNATVVDPDHGAITITAQNVTFGGCTSGVPTGGTITVSGNGQTATVTFIDCNSFSINYGGSTTTHNWSTYGL